MKGKTTLEDANKNELYYMWLFLLGVSIEYKNNKLSYEDRRTLDCFQDIASPSFDIDLEENDIVASDLFADEIVKSEETKKYTEEENRKYSKWFYRTYIKLYEKKAFFLPTVYDFITSGSTLQGESLVKELAVVNPPIQDTPPQVLLMKRFMTGVWNFKDAEFSAALDALYNYVKSASFGDYITYLNAAFFICAYKQILSDDEATIKDNIKSAIDSFTEKVEQKMAAMEPKETLSLARMLKDRYIGINPLPIALAAEMPFVKAIRDGLAKRNEPKRILSNKMIEQELQPIVEKVLREYGRNIDQPEQTVKHDKEHNT